MPNYQLGKIYKIIDYTNDNIYIGSTTEPTLAKRLSKHRDNLKRWKNGKYNKCMSFNILENDNYDIVLLESCPCNTKDELLAREKYYIQNNNCVNKVIPLRTHKEYYEDNKEEINEKKKQHYKDNAEHIKQKVKEYKLKKPEAIIAQRQEYKTNCKEHIQEWTKEYRLKNRERLNKYARERYAKNKSIISELKSEGETEII